jgi:raffinose/stachyose/melibiose transport system substrate-binding protein
MTVIRRSTATAALLAAVATVAACAPGSTPAATGSASPVSTTVTTDNITLTLATSEAAGMTPKLISGFEKLHPNITINLNQSSFDDFNKSINLQLASDTSPDIALVNLYGTSVKDGLLLNLDNYTTAYGWDQKLSKSALDAWRVQPDGMTQGGGKLYALPGGFSIVGLFYNKTILSSLGISAAPATLDQFEQDLATAKAAGVTGLEVAAKSGHTAFNIQAVAEQYDTPDVLNSWIFGAHGSTFDTPGVQKGVAALARWANAGYLNASANGTDLQGAVSDFGNGKALFLHDGSWDAVAIDKALGAKAGFVPYPTVAAGDPANGMSGGVAYAISARSKHPTEAAAFLNYMISAQAGDAVLSSGFLPVDTSNVTAPTAPVMGDIVKGWTTVTKGGHVYGFFAAASPTMNDTLTQTTQELIAGRTTADALIAAVQADWAKAHS